MKNPNLTSHCDPHRRVTTIYLIDGTPLIVEVIEWGGGSTPAIVRTLDNEVWRQGIEASWSCYPNQAVADAFRKMRQAALMRLLLVSDTGSTDVRNAA